MINNKVFQYLANLALFISVFFICQTASAAKLEFSPSSGSYNTGEGFEVEVKVDTSSEETQCTDAVVIFDNTLLDVDNVSYGEFYPTVLHSEQDNKLYISGVVDNPGSTKSGSGVLATITFKGTSAGTAAVSFECEAGRTDVSNITKDDDDATDIIDCASLEAASYTLSGDSTEPTAAPTAEPVATTVPNSQNGAVGGATDTTIPETGFFDIAQLLPKILMGLVFVAIGLVPLLI